MARITDVDVADIHCPTSRELDGSDAMNPDLDHTAAYVILRTDDPDGVEGHAFTFTIGHGNGDAACESELPEHDCPGFTTSPGWFGYSDEKLTRPAREADAGGFSRIKPKADAELAADIRSLRTADAAAGPNSRIAIDANQRWNVSEAVEWTNAPAGSDPYWIEEPTSPDDADTFWTADRSDRSDREETHR